MLAKRKRLPRVYWGYLLLLVATLTLFVTLALRDEDLAIFFELKRMDVSSELGESGVELSDRWPVDSAQLADAEILTDTIPVVWADTAAIVKSTHYEYPLDTTGDSTSAKILLIGDSMNEFLRLRLNDYCIANGYKLECVIWYGSTTKQYGTCDTLAYFIRKYRPTYVLLTIGANELFIRDIIKKRTPYVQHIISQLGNIPFVWVGPPNWKDDTGINELILSHVGSSRYFESKRLSFDRCKDGAHPTKKSAFRWMDEIAAYLASDAQHTLVMNTPDTAYNKAPHTTILQMVRE